MSDLISRRRFHQGLLGFAALTAARPELAIAANGPRQYELVARKYAKSLTGPGGNNSELWGYNGQTPGPLLNARVGEEIEVNFRNELDTPTSIHWHGLRIANEMDGVSGLTQKAVEPGENFTYRFIPPDSGTYWYHAHNRSWLEVERGLYGPLIVTEDNPSFADTADILLMLDDWRLDQAGRFDDASLGNMMDWSHNGRLGNFLTVNGDNRPIIEVPSNTWLRLRLINACNSRILEIDPNRIGARVMAYDGQSIGAPRKLGYAPLLLGPAQRADLLVQFDTAGPIALEEMSQSAPYEFATLNVTDSATGNTSREPALPASALPEPDLNAAAEFELLMEGGAMGQMGQLIYNGRVQSRMDFMSNKQVWGFNGVANLADDPFFKVSRGQSVIVNVINRTSFMHAMHTHGHHFKILKRNGETDSEQAWRDTFLVGPNGTTQIAFVADNPGKWLFHCHMLEHAAAGMTTWFDVV